MISVLYVDDEPDLLELGKRYLEVTEEFTVTTALSASIGLGLLQSNGIQAIVSDFMMPGMDGIEFLKQVRATDKTIPFIMFTGKGREEIAIEAFENGADFYLQKGGALKPQFAELMHKIKAAVDHRQADLRVTTLNRLYSVLSATNRAIVRIHDTRELLSEICRIVVEIGGFRMAWAGQVDREKHTIEPVAAHGFIDGYFDTIAISTEAIPRGKGPTGTAFREKRYNFCNDVASDPKMEPWRDGALARGYRALAAFPFALDTGNAGVVTCYASVPGFFDEEIIKLLEEQSQDISFALVAISAEEQRKHAEIDLKKSELRYRRLFETAQDAILILDGDTGEIIDANKFILNLLGYPLEYFVGKHLWELGFLQNKSQAQQAFTELKTEGYVRYEDLPLETRGGTRIQVEFVSNVYLVEGKKIIQCNIRDITERKATADALALASKKLSLMSSITRHDILNQLMVLKGLLYLSHDYVNDPVLLTDSIRKEEDAASVIERQITFTRDYQDMGVNSAFWHSVHDSIGRAGAALPLGDIRLENRVDNLEIFADPLLEKVFFNLIDNALKYGGDRMTMIRVSSYDSAGGVSIVCEDDGKGISHEDKRSLFKQGFGKNTGLGLFLTREILSITGITITESSISGKGARFEITVPKGVYRFPGRLPKIITGKGPGSDEISADRLPS